MNYSSIIKKIRGESGLTQTEFGRKLGLSLQTIQKYEAGSRKPPETLKKLIPYVFAEYIDEEMGLGTIPAREKYKSSDGATLFVTESEEKAKHIANKLHEKDLKIQALEDHVKQLNELNDLLKENNTLLKDQIELYKNRLGDNGAKSAS